MRHLLLGLPAGLALLGLSSAAMADPHSPPPASHSARAVVPRAAHHAARPLSAATPLAASRRGVPARASAPKKAEPAVTDVDAREPSTEPGAAVRIIHLRSGDFSPVPVYANGRSATVHATASGEQFVLPPDGPSLKARTPATTPTQATPATQPPTSPTMMAPARPRTQAHATRAPSATAAPPPGRTPRVVSLPAPTARPSAPALPPPTRQ